MNFYNEEFLRKARDEAEIIKDGMEVFLRTYYKKPFILDYRVKSLEKLELKKKTFGYNTITQAPDIIGIRISVPKEDGVVEISSLIEKYLSPTKLIDYFNTPRQTGFKAFLYYFNTTINSEIQIMTTEMRDWTNRTHDEHNLRKYGTTFEQEKKLTNDDVTYIVDTY